MIKKIKIKKKKIKKKEGKEGIKRGKSKDLLIILLQYRITPRLNFFSSIKAVILLILNDEIIHQNSELNSGPDAQVECE